MLERKGSRDRGTRRAAPRLFIVAVHHTPRR
jgi:hypothetical protein